MQSPSPSLAWNGNFEEAEVWPTLFCFLPLFLLHGRGSSSWVLCSKTNHCHIDRPTRELAPWHAKLSTEFPQALTEILEMVRLRLHEVCSCCSLTVLTGPAIDLLKYVLRIFKWTVYFLPTLLWCKSQYSSHSSQLYIKVNKEAYSMTDNRCTNLGNSYTSSVLSQKRIKWQIWYCKGTLPTNVEAYDLPTIDNCRQMGK